jgi:Domain of unknown function (DUF6378)
MSDELQPVEKFIDDRSKVYGEPVDCWTRIAQVWTGILAVEVTPAEAVLCMIGLKAVRTAIAPDYADNSDDIDGYLEIFRRLVGTDMVRARTVEEYLQVRRVLHGKPS